MKAVTKITFLNDNNEKFFGEAPKAGQFRT